MFVGDVIAGQAAGADLWGEMAIPIQNSTIDQPLTLAWESFAASAIYNLQVASDQLFSNIVIDIETADTSHETNDLDLTTQHYWRVRGHN